MILANTKATGYSLGLALYWPNNPTQLSTGLIQAVSLSFLLPKNAKIPTPEITKYTVADNQLSLAISWDDGFCTMTGALSNSYTVYSLESTSEQFVGGWVGLYPNTEERHLNLVGAFINPLFVHVSIETPTQNPQFRLRQGTSSTETIPLTSLRVSTTPDVVVTSSGDVSGGGIVYSCSANEALTPSIPVDSSSIYYINGSAIRADGHASLLLPSGWTAVGNGLGARIANPSNTPSCVAQDYIVEALGPQNFADHGNPLAIAFSGGSLNLAPIINGEVLFNSEYEGNGLRWDQFSPQHDVWSTQSS